MQAGRRGEEEKGRDSTGRRDQSSDIVFTSFVLRQSCFDLINSQLRKYKKAQCGVCYLDFYPLWDD